MHRQLPVPRDRFIEALGVRVCAVIILVPVADTKEERRVCSTDHGVDHEHNPDESVAHMRWEQEGPKPTAEANLVRNRLD
eukprot:3678517-Prymnesium_polylepis.2